MLPLVRHDYLVRGEDPFRTEGYVYSMSARGAAELADLGECYTGLPRRPVDGQLPKAVYHAIDLNEIHLQLVRWTPDTEIRSRNEFTDSGYKKGLRCGPYAPLAVRSAFRGRPRDTFFPK